MQESGTPPSHSDPASRIHNATRPRLQAEATPFVSPPPPPPLRGASSEPLAGGMDAASVAVSEASADAGDTGSAVGGGSSRDAHCDSARSRASAASPASGSSGPLRAAQRRLRF